MLLEQMQDAKSLAILDSFGSGCVLLCCFFMLLMRLCIAGGVLRLNMLHGQASVLVLGVAE